MSEITSSKEPQRTMHYGNVFRNRRRTQIMFTEREQTTVYVNQLTSFQSKMNFHFIVEQYSSTVCHTYHKFKKLDTNKLNSY